jgi:hypothetical protein
LLSTHRELGQLAPFPKAKGARIDLYALRRKLLKVKSIASMNTSQDHKFSYISLVGDSEVP